MEYYSSFFFLSPFTFPLLLGPEQIAFAPLGGACTSVTDRSDGLYVPLFDSCQLTHSPMEYPPGLGYSALTESINAEDL